MHSVTHYYSALQLMSLLLPCRARTWSQGVLAAIQGWGDVRLLAPHAELEPHIGSELCTASHTVIHCCAAVQGKDLSQGVLAAIPGWGDVRLLAPHAELKLQVCGQVPLIDGDRLRCDKLSNSHTAAGKQACGHRQQSSQACIAAYQAGYTCSTVVEALRSVLDLHQLTSTSIEPFKVLHLTMH